VLQSVLSCSVYNGERFEDALRVCGNK